MKKVKLKIECEPNEVHFTRAICIGQKIYYIRVVVEDLPEIKFE